MLDFFQLGAYRGVNYGLIWPDIHLLPFFLYYKYVIFWKQSLRRYLCYLCKLLKWARSESIHVFSKNMLFSTTNNFLVLQMPWSIIKELIWRGFFGFFVWVGFFFFAVSLLKSNIIITHRIRSAGWGRVHVIQNTNKNIPYMYEQIKEFNDRDSLNYGDVFVCRLA